MVFSREIVAMNHAELKPKINYKDVIKNGDENWKPNNISYVGESIFCIYSPFKVL